MRIFSGPFRVKIIQFKKKLILLNEFHTRHGSKYDLTCALLYFFNNLFLVAAVRIFNLICLMMLIGHWNGCLQGDFQIDAP